MKCSTKSCLVILSFLPELKYSTQHAIGTFFSLALWKPQCEPNWVSHYMVLVAHFTILLRYLVKGLLEMLKTISTIFSPHFLWKSICSKWIQRRIHSGMLPIPLKCFVSYKLFRDQKQGVNILKKSLPSIHHLAMQKLIISMQYGQTQKHQNFVLVRLFFLGQNSH